MYTSELNSQLLQTIEQYNRQNIQEKWAEKTFICCLQVEVTN